MTSLTKVASAKPQQTQEQIWANEHIKDLTATIDDAVPSFPTAISGLVAEYLTYKPTTTKWKAFWADDLGREVCTKAVAAENTITGFNRPLTQLIAQYLQMDIIGLKDLEEAARGPEALAKLLPNYSPEDPLPAQIDDIVQTDLSAIFSPRALMGITATKVGEMFFLIWRPRDMSGNLAMQIAQNAPKNPTQFHEYHWKEAVQEHGGTRALRDGWLLASRYVIGGGLPFDDQCALIPRDHELSDFCDAVYCPVLFYAATGQRILEQDFARIKAMTQGLRVAIGGFGARGLYVNVSILNGVYGGVFPLREFCFRPLALGPLALGHGH